MCSAWVTLTALSSSLLIRSSVSSYLLLIPSSVFFYFSCFVLHLCSVLLYVSHSLLDFPPCSFILLLTLLNIFTITTSTSILGRLIISTLLSSSSGIFILFLCLEHFPLWPHLASFSVSIFTTC